jgi:hypothetical protein
MANGVTQFGGQVQIRGVWEEFLSRYGVDTIVYGIAALLVVAGLLGMVLASGAVEAAVKVAT